jgi:hypothetical protein
MSACSQCGTVAKATDRFCNVCGTPLPRPPAAGAPSSNSAPGQRAPTPPPAGPPPGGFGPPAHALAATAMATHRCQMGHEISPGASYCAQGHPIALDQMQFSSDAYGAPPAYGAPQPPPAYGTPAPSPGYGAPQPQAYAPQPQQPAYAPPAPQPVYAPPPAYAPPAPQAYAPAPQQGYGPAGGYVPSPQGGYAPANAYAPQPAYAPPEPPRDPTPSKILRGFLVAYGMNPSGDFWPLTGGRLVVGRLGPGDGVDITLQDPTISSRHGAIVVDPVSGSITMEDTGSTNGTFVNDEHIGFNGRRELRDGDRLRLGGFTTVVKVIGRI